jgi:hypothetical protein
MEKTKIFQKVGQQTFEWLEAVMKAAGGRLEHDQRNIGKDHKHGQVQPGGGKTGDPEA